MVADELRAMRLELKKSPEQMAKIAGVSGQTYRNWENGLGEPRVTHYRRIFAVCSARSDNFFFSSDTKSLFLDTLGCIPKKLLKEIKAKLIENKE